MMRMRLILVLSLFAGGGLLGCADSYYTERWNDDETVYRYDKEGNKRLIYELKDGKLTVHDPEDPMAKSAMAAQKYAQKKRQRETERLAGIRQAPKRHPNDPILVAFPPIELNYQLKEAQHSSGSVDAEVMKHFQNDPILRFVDRKKMAQNEKLREKGFLYIGDEASDVVVSAYASLTRQAAYNKTTRTFGEAPMVTMKAVIRSNFLPDRYEVKEVGHVLANVKVAERFAAKIRNVILSRIGPTIPADREAFRK